MKSLYITYQSSSASTAIRVFALLFIGLLVAACDSGSGVVDPSPDESASSDDLVMTSTIHETTIDGVTYQTEIESSSTGVGGQEKFVHRIDYVPQPTTTTYTQQETLTFSYTASGTLSVEAAFEAAGVGGITIGGSTSYSRTFTEADMQSSAIEIELDTGEAADVFASTTGRYYNIRQRTCNLLGCSDWQHSTVFAPEGVQLRYEVESIPPLKCAIIENTGEWCGPTPFKNRIQIRAEDGASFSSNRNSTCGTWSGGEACQLELLKDGSPVWDSGGGRYYTAGSVTVQDGPCGDTGTNQCGVAGDRLTILDQ